MDEKNRVVIPSKWKESIGKNIVLVDGFEGAVEIRTKASFLQHYQKSINSADSYLKEARTLKRKILGNAHEIVLDKWYRFTIPTKFNRGFKGSVLLRGNGDSIELWSKEAYEAWSNDEENTIEKAAEVIASR